MTDIKAAQSGPWSATSTWTGGVLPGSGDVAYANSFDVTIDQDITVTRLSRANGGGASANHGGTFLIGSAVTVTITGGVTEPDINGTYSAATPFIKIGSGAYNVTINANLTSGNNGSNLSAVATLTGYTGTLTINGNVNNADAAGYQSDHTILIGSACTFILNGNVAITAGAKSMGIKVTGANSNITINGDVNAGAYYGINITANPAVITINGNITGGSAYPALYVDGSAQVTIHGGLITGGGQLNAPGVSVLTGSLRVDAILKFGATGAAPIHGNVPPQFIQTSTILGIQAPSDGNWPLATAAPITIQRYNTDLPSPEDVREGTNYGTGWTSEGTLSVPDAASVAYGVPVDDTVGSAALDLDQVVSIIGSQLSAALSPL